MFPAGRKGFRQKNAQSVAMPVIISEGTDNIRQLLDALSKQDLARVA